MTSKYSIGTVMLIDDEKIDQLMYRRIISKSGIVRNQIAFQYADEALNYLKRTDREDIDIIFLDINMPRMDGFEFLDAATRELGESFAKAVVVMLTTSLNPSDRDRALSYGVVREFINKPLTPDHLGRLAGLISPNSPF